jgi:hypothetical protein
MKAFFVSPIFTGRSAMMAVVVVVLLGFGSAARAQINESKIERDASGVYSGTGSGARYSVTYDDPLLMPHSGTVDPISARVRVPVKDGALSSGFADSELPAGRATAKGAEKRSDVIRGGKRIVVKAIGTLNLFEGPTKGVWTSGLLQGFLDDKGAKWKADTKGSAQQRNKTDPLLPADHTKRVTGMLLKGNG